MGKADNYWFNINDMCPLENWNWKEFTNCVAGNGNYEKAVKKACLIEH